MRSQASKPSPKKGALNKPKFKATTKQSKKKKVSPKKSKTLANNLVKSPKKIKVKDNFTIKNDIEPITGDKNELSPESPKAGTSKSAGSESPNKKSKKEIKEKKDIIKPASQTGDPNTKKTGAKKPNKSVKTTKIPKKDDVDTDDVKYKINSDVAKKTPVKFTKAKKVIKKGSISNKKKKSSIVTDKEKNPNAKENEFKEEPYNKDQNKNDQKIENEIGSGVDVVENIDITRSDQCKDTKKIEEHDSKVEDKSEHKGADGIILDNTAPLSQPQPCNNQSTDILPSSECSANNQASNLQPEQPKVENERPPKFFTSARTPRTVDIDVKFCKNSKGNSTSSDRFLSMKVETKTDDTNKTKSTPNTLVSQGPDVDVYTFTDKVDSPKSILSDFRSPVTKNVGRVRPIARVKGTVIDKKSDSEKKKYSPHRPIEEVVKQLKANKRSEELSASATHIPLSTQGNEYMQNSEKDQDDSPKPIVSKSYKMVARKSSVTGKPFSPKFFEQEPTSNKNDKSAKAQSSSPTKKILSKPKKQQKKAIMSDKEIDNSKFSLNTKNYHYESSEESLNESNDDNDSKESSGSDSPKTKKTKNKKYKKITDGYKKPKPSKELMELSKDSLIDLKDSSLLFGEKPSKRRLKLLSMWAGPKKHRMASLNAMAKVHCLYENESRTHMELGLMKTVDRQIIPSTSKSNTLSKKKESKQKETEKTTSNSESEYENKNEKKDESSESSDDNLPQRTLRGVPGIRSAGKYWDPKSSTSSSEDSELETKMQSVTIDKKKSSSKTSPVKSDTEKPPAKMKKTSGVPIKKKRNRNEVVMDLKDMVVQKRMASLNATAILAASYEKRSPKSNKEDTTSDSCSDESFTQKPKTTANSGIKSETKVEDTKKEGDESSLADIKQKVEVIVNQDTDVTITGVYSTHHEGFCTAMQYRISSTSHTQTTATANCDKEGCSRDDGSRYTPLSALSSMQPPAEHAHGHPHPVPELGGLARRAAGCSSAFSAPSPSAHHDPGYYQPAGPLIKETGAEAERALARYHPQPHYHAPHPPVLQQYGPPYYPPDLCYGRYYRPTGAYHMPPPQPDAQMVGVGSEPYPPPQYYGTPPCYQHSPQRSICPPYVEYRCPCPLSACPKNVLIGPATGKAPTGGGPADVPSALAPPGGAFRTKVRACALDTVADTHGSGKDPPLESEPPAAADAPHPCPLPAIGGASPKRELYDVRDNLRLAGDIPGPAEPIGPPSPARGSAGACAPQPPPAAPRRARLGKAMARRSLAGDDTGLLLSVPPPLIPHTDTDDDVLAISPPICGPIDLSSSDERSTPLVDVKKENEGPTNSLTRKTDAQALREHNCTAVSGQNDSTVTAKAVKRRYSKPKLEIDMKDTQLEDGCKTNGIGEHVKLQKRRKVSGEPDVRQETITKEPRKKTSSPTKKSCKTSAEKKSVKRKLENNNGPKTKKTLIEFSGVTEDPRLHNPAAIIDNTSPKSQSKIKKAESINVPKVKKLVTGVLEMDDKRLQNPATVVDDSASKSQPKIKKIDNVIALKPIKPLDDFPGTESPRLKSITEVIDESAPKSQPKTKSALLLDNLIRKNSIDRPDSKGFGSETLNPAELFLEPDENIIQGNSKKTLNINNNVVESKSSPTVNSVRPNTIAAVSQLLGKKLVNKNTCKVDKVDSKISHTKAVLNTKVDDVVKNDEIEKQTENIESVVKETPKIDAIEKLPFKAPKARLVRDPEAVKRAKLHAGEMKGKVEKPKLLVKKPVFKVDEAACVVEEACSRGLEVGRGRRRRSGGARRRRALLPPPPPDAEPRAPPRWSNGWNFDGEHYLSKVYLSNDSRLDRTAHCWPRMRHASGDSVARGDCVLLRASAARAQPYVARVASLWQNPDDGNAALHVITYIHTYIHIPHGALLAAHAPRERRQRGARRLRAAARLRRARAALRGARGQPLAEPRRR
ncbi:hypothetical protein ACJJTC_006229 [Scirpophaga incertulas]